MQVRDYKKVNFFFMASGKILLKANVFGEVVKRNVLIGIKLLEELMNIYCFRKVASQVIIGSVTN